MSSRIITLTTLATLAAVAVGGITFAHGPGMGGGRGGGYGHMYFDSNSIVDVTGTVTRLYADEWESWGHGNHTGGGMGIEFRTDGGEMFDLMLAPTWFLDESGIDLQQGERISLRGSVVDNYYGGGMGGGMMGQYPGRGDNDYLIAVSITADGKTVELRDAYGYPLWRMNGGGGMPWFDADTVKTLKGTLSSSLGLWSCWGYGNYTGNGMHYTFTSAGVEYYAMLAPWWYLEEQGIDLEENSQVTIRGSVVEPYWSGYDDADYLIAIELTVGKKTVKLRDGNGYPLWYGGGWYYSAPAYQSKTVSDIAGEVLRTRLRARGEGTDRGLELIVKGGGQKYTVFLAPEWFIAQTGFVAVKGDHLSIRGSVIDAGQGQKQIVAVRVTVGGKKTNFRSSDGTPRWIKGAR